MKIFILLLAGVSMATAQQWPQYLGPNGDGTANGSVSAAVQKAGPKTLWAKDIGKGCSSFAISGGRVFTTGNKNDQDTLWCFDAQTGKELWKKTYPEKLAAKFYEGGPGATPAIDGERVYSLSKSGDLFCYHVKTGAKIWSVDFKKDFRGNKPTWGFSSSPVIYNDLLLTLPCAKKGAMVALDKKTGKLVWQSSNTARPGYAAPVFFKYRGKDAALVFHGRKLVGYDLSAKGAVLFEHTWRTPYDVNASNPQVLGDKVFLAAGYGMGHAILDISEEKPKETHRERDLPIIFQNVYQENGDLIGCFGDKNFKTELFRMDFASGKIRWRKKLPGTRGSVASIGKTTIILCETGDLIFGTAGKNGFRETGRSKIPGKRYWAPLAVGEGKLFGRTNEGQMICLGLK